MTGQQRPTCVGGKRRDRDCNLAQSVVEVAVQMGAMVKMEVKLCAKERRGGLMIKSLRHIKTELKLMGTNCIID